MPTDLQTTQRAIPSPREARAGRGPGRGAASKTLARLLRRNQTKEEKELWRALKAGRFAGFKFRRQHQVGDHYLDFYCPTAKLSVELDGFQHGLPEQMQRDAERAKFLAIQGIEELRFWNHQWNTNREGVLLEIWEALYRRTGCIAVMRKVQNHRFIPPNPDQIIPKKGNSMVIRYFQEHLLSPALSSIPNGGEGVAARVNHAIRSCKRHSAHLIPSPRSEARGEGVSSFSKLHFTIPP